MRLDANSAFGSTSERPYTLRKRVPRRVLAGFEDWWPVLKWRVAGFAFWQIFIPIIPWGKCPSDEKKAAAEAALIKEHGRNIEIIHVITGVRGCDDDDD